MNGNIPEQISLRDWFAGMAVSAWLSTFGPEADHPSKYGLATEVAKEAYAIADAMLLVRKELESQNARP